MCYSNNNCGCGRNSGSCFSCSSSACCNNSTRSCSCGGRSGCQEMPYYINPCGWYTQPARVAVVAFVSVCGDGNNDGCGSGCC